MTFDECMAFLNGRIDYERRGMPTSKELRLDRMRALLERLGNPHCRYQVVHVAGTKGKGSTANMIAAMLRSAGHAVGMHTSPHLVRIHERFWFDGETATDAELAELAAIVMPAVRVVDENLSNEQPGLTFFEVTTAMAFVHFARKGADWSVIEVGMGGRLDSTNVVAPAACVITSIGLDHTQQLGNTLAAIAAEKAGILKRGVPVICGVEEDEPREKIANVAVELDCPLWQLGRDFHLANLKTSGTGTESEVITPRRHWSKVRLPVVGHHQARNAAVAIATMDSLVERGLKFEISCATQALERLQLRARIEIVPGCPVLVVDSAHNEPSAIALVSSLAQLESAGVLPSGPRLLVFAVARDKRWCAMLDILTPHFQILVATTFRTNPRCLSVDEMLDGTWRPPASLQVHREEDPIAAFAWACRRLQREPATEPGYIAVTGSIFLAGELMETIRRNGQP